MTKNKKKRRRAERKSVYSDVVKTLALTGLLLASGAGVAGAEADITTDPMLGTDTTLTTSKTLTGSYTVAPGGHLTLTNARLGYFETATESIFNLKPGGALTVSGDSRVDVHKVNITGGTINITGAQNSWDQAAYVGGYEGLTVSGANTAINMNKNSGLFIGHTVESGATTGFKMTLAGGTITMNGGTSGFDKDSAHIWAGSPGDTSTRNLLELSGANIVVKADTFGVISSQQTAMSAGSIKVSGNLLLQANPGPKNDAVDSSILSAGKGTFDMTGGTITVDNKGFLEVRNTDFNLTGGTVTVADTGKLDFVSDNVNLNLNGGALKTGLLTVDNNAAATGVSAKNLTITSGKYDLAKVAVKNGTLKINGGTLDTKLGTLKLATSGNITIGSEGALTVYKGSYLSSDTEVGVLHLNPDGVSKKIETYGRLQISGYEGGNIYITDARATRSRLMAGNGLFEFLGARIFTDADTDLSEVGGVSTPTAVVKAVKENQPGTVTATESFEVAAIDYAGSIGTSSLTINQDVTGSFTGANTIINAHNVVTIDGAGSVALGSTINGTGTTHAGGVNIGGILSSNAGTGVSVVQGNVAASQVQAIAGNLQLKQNVTADAHIENGMSLVVGGTLTTKQDGAQVANGVLQVAGLLDVSAGGASVGNSTSAGLLNSARLTLGSKMLFADPGWTAGKSSIVAIGGFGNDGTGPVDGAVVAGQNSHITLGLADNGAWLANKNIKNATKGGLLTEGGITAAMGIYQPMNLGLAGSVMVDGTLVMGTGKNAKNPVHVAAGGVETPFTPVANRATFAENSLLAVYAPNALGKAALNATQGVLKVDANSKLMIVDGRLGETVKIVSGFADASSTMDTTSWTGTNLLTNSEMVTASPDAAFVAGTGTYNIKIAMGKSAGELFPQLQPETANLVTALYAQGLNDTQSPNAGIKFLSRATANNENYVDNAQQAASTVEGAAQLAVAGATQGMTLSALNAATNAVTTRTSFASPLLDKTKSVAMNLDTDGNVSLDSGLSAGSGMKNGLGLWIMPLYQSENVWGMKAENFKTGYTSDLGGVALGADYTFADAFRVGMALNMGGGYAQSSGDFNKTENSFNFWGVGLYGGWAQDNFGLTADVGYSNNYNKVKQELPASMQMGELKADVTSYAITTGLRGEYKIETAIVDIIPHISARYTSLNTDNYDVKHDGTVFSVDQSNQNIWTFPIGVTFSKDVEMNSGWIFKPQVDLAIIPAAGDVKTKSKSHIPGVNSKAELETQVVDYMTYQGGIGFDIQNDNLSFGINYNIQASEHRTGHRVFGTVRYEF